MFDDLFKRIRAASSLPTLTDEETALLEAWLDDHPEPPRHYCSEEERGILSVWGETDPVDRDFWTLLRATLKYNRGRTAPSPAEQPQAAPAEPQSAPSETPQEPERVEDDATGVSWQDAAERMERLRAQGEPFTSRHTLAKRFGCSSGTIHKAIQRTPSLQAWAKSECPTAPRAQSLNDVVTDRAAQHCELDPADDAAIREFIEGADTDAKAWFLALSTEDQLSYLNDPGKHTRIRGRKP